MLFRDLIPFTDTRPMKAERRQLDPLHAMQREMNRMFKGVWEDFDLPTWRGDNGDFGELADFAPSLDVSETDNQFRVTAELPGMEEKDVEVTFADGVLSIAGEHKEEKEEKDEDEKYYLRECSYGSFRRALPLGDRVDADKVKAKFKNGKLTVILPKTKEAKEKIKRIPITH